MSQISDGVMVGSASIKLLKKYKTEAPKYIGKYVKEMKEVMN